MDILNFISWLKGGRLVKTVDPKQSLVPIATRDSNRDDSWITNAMTVEDLANQIGGGGPVVDPDGNLIIADSSNDTVTVTPGGTHLIDNFSGMLIVNDHYDGRVETWIAGGGDAVLLGATNLGGSPCGSTITMAASGYEWTNVDNLVGPFTFTVVKTRLGN